MKTINIDIDQAVHTWKKKELTLTLTLTLTMLLMHKKELTLTGSRTLSLMHTRLLLYPFSYSCQLEKLNIVQLLMEPQNWH